MNKKSIIFYAIAFAAGLITGTTGTVVAVKIKNKKEKKERTSPLLSKDVVKETEHKEPETEAEVDAKANEEAQEIIRQEGYAEDPAETESPEDDDPEDAKLKAQLKAKQQWETYHAAHKGKIEMMREDEWDTDFPEEDYSHQELWYFPDEDVLTDEDGALIEPIEDYVGNIFDKTNFPNNDWEKIYIRNHPKEEDYYIHKETRMSREEFFY